MQVQSDAPATRKRGLFARVFGGLKARLMRIFGKDEAPNIYPFF